MTQRRVDGIGPEDDDEAPGVKAWNRYLQHADAVDGDAEAKAAEREASEQAAARAAAEEQARARQAGPTSLEKTYQKDRGGPIASAMGAAAAGAAALGRFFKESPEDRRIDVMAAMQAEALARLEIAPHAEQVMAAQREGDGSNPAAAAAGKVLSEERRLDREEKDTELPAARKPDATRPAPDFVQRAKKGEAKEADRRQAERRDAERREAEDRRRRDQDAR